MSDTSESSKKPSSGLLARWFGHSVRPDAPPQASPNKVNWIRSIPYLALHLTCLAVIWVGWSPVAVGVAAGLYAVRMFAITGFYHRFFAHRAFKTSRAGQFLFGILGCSAVQRGPLWWAAHHRHHHVHSDDEHDLHSPRQHGLLHSHNGWFLTPAALRTRWKLVPDLARYPELRFLDRFELLVPVLLALGLFAVGAFLGAFAPELGTSGPQLLVWGFFISTVAVYQGTYLINSLSHCIGRRRFATHDDSRNSLVLALLTFGEGWHNNHHHYPASARQGFYWWEIDITYYLLVVLSWTGLVWDLKPVPESVLSRALEQAPPTSPGEELAQASPAGEAVVPTSIVPPLPAPVPLPAPST